jgi:hypothetical protein
MRAVVAGRKAPCVLNKGAHVTKKTHAVLTEIPSAMRCMRTSCAAQIVIRVQLQHQ